MALLKALPPVSTEVCEILASAHFKRKFELYNAIGYFSVNSQSEESSGQRFALQDLGKCQYQVNFRALRALKICPILMKFAHKLEKMLHRTG